jgi:hypothetical protein
MKIYVNPIREVVRALEFADHRAAYSTLVVSIAFWNEIREAIKF